MMLKNIIVLFFLITAAQNIYGQLTQLPKSNNSPNEVGVTNTHIYYFSHRLPYNIDVSETFKPYIAYINQEGYPEDFLFDSFLLYDIFYHQNNYNGIYQQEDFDFYLNNIFTVTKPIEIIQGGGFTQKYAYLGNKKYGGISQRFVSIDGIGDYQMAFEINSNTNNQTNLMGIGLEFYDSNYNKIQMANIYSSPQLIYSEFLDVHYRYFSYGSSWETKNLNFSISNANIAYVTIHFFNNSPNEEQKRIYIDNTYLTNISTPTDNLLEDDGFNQSSQTSSWESGNLERTANTKLNFLFQGRKPLLSGLNDAKNDLSIDLPETKIILILPKINIDYYDSNNKWDDLYEEIDLYYNKIEQLFNNWKSENNNPNISIAGVYYVEESIRYIDKVQKLAPVFNYINNLNTQRNWKLFASPHNLLAFDYLNCEIASAYHEILTQYFDVLWQQPNVFSNYFINGTNVDREVLRYTTDYSINQKMGINMEYSILDTINTNETYGRINDYFYYGEKYGYINQSKCYYDHGGLNYINYTSANTNMRSDYENLYIFIKKGREGVVVNNRFEHINEKNNSKLYNWIGDYSILKNDFSTSHIKDLSFVTTQQDPIIYSDYFTINSNKSYDINFSIKSEAVGDLINKALMGIQFYDNSGNLVPFPLSNTNLTYSPFLEAWYKYFSPSLTFNNGNIYFSPPLNAVKARIFIRSWETTIPITWKDLNLSYNNTPRPRFFYKKSLNFLHLEDNLIFGNYSILLDNNKYIKTSEKIPVLANKEYTLTLDIKEKLPVLNNSIDKGLFAIEAYDSQGNIITPQISGLNFSSFLNMNYFYFYSINSNWNKYQRKFTFPTEVASIKILLRNFYYENNIIIDNISLTVDSSSNIHFEKHNWNQIYPAIVKFKEPLLYDELIDVSDYSLIKVSALLREINNDENPYNGLLAIEFMDEDYNHLEEDISVSNLVWSPYYKFWYKYFVINTEDCDGTITWFSNKWNRQEVNFGVPIEAKWVRMSIHNLASNPYNEIRILDIQIESLSRLASDKQNTLYEQSQLYIPNSMFLAPMPAYDYIDVSFDKEYNDIISAYYVIYDMKGSILKQENISNIIFKISELNKLSSGGYILKVVINGDVYTKQIIIK